MQRLDDDFLNWISTCKRKEGIYILVEYILRIPNSSVEEQTNPRAKSNTQISRLDNDVCSKKKKKKRRDYCPISHKDKYGKVGIRHEESLVQNPWHNKIKVINLKRKVKVGNFIFRAT